MTSPITLLGPQRFNPHIAAALDDAGVAGPVAAVTAGWQEREAEIDELSEHLSLPVHNLSLYRRAESLFLQNPEFHRAYRARQNRLRRLQKYYRLRLEKLLEVARRFMRTADDDLIDAERESALDDVRRLDEHHRSRIEQTHLEFDAQWPIERIDELSRHRQEIAETMATCEALCIAGGHVIVLLNRLRLFDIRSMIGDRVVVAWSAGAMALGTRIIAFHDSPPQGAGNAEILEMGLGLHHEVALPHASKRLRLDDAIRVAIFARRFHPQRCIALDTGAQVQREQSQWTANEFTRVLTRTGELVEMGRA